MVRCIVFAGDCLYITRRWLLYKFTQHLRCVNFQCQGVLLIWIIVGQGPVALAVGAGGGCLDIFSLVYLFLSPSLGDGPI